jgi:hypothetical protein
MDLTLSEEFARIPDLRHQVRSLHGFLDSFGRGTSLAAAHLGARAETDQAPSTKAFLSWAEKFTSQKPYAALNRQDFCVFSCGLLLAELIRTAPLRVWVDPRRVERGTLPIQTLAVADFWPEGFILTSYCASVLDAILHQDFATSVAFAPVATDLRTWWSFRENVQEDPSTAIGFFDLFLSQEPNWLQPEAVLQRSGFRGTGPQEQEPGHGQDIRFMSAMPS